MLVLRDATFAVARAGDAARPRPAALFEATPLRDPPAREAGDLVATLFLAGVALAAVLFFTAAPFVALDAAVALDAVPLDTVLLDAVPLDAVPLDAVPLDAVPLEPALFLIAPPRPEVLATLLVDFFEADFEAAPLRPFDVAIGLVVLFRGIK